MRVIIVLFVLAAACSAEKKTTCPEDQLPEAGKCVSRCADGLAWRDGECAPTADNLLARLESARDVACKCADDACRAKAQTSFRLLLEAVRSAKSAASSAELDRATAATAAVEKCTGGEKKDAIESLAAIEKKMCTCEDRRCASAASAEFDRWMSSPTGRAASKVDKDRVMTISKAYTACMNAAMK